MRTSQKRHRQLKAYYESNRDTILAKRRARYQSNKALLTAKCREYYRRNRRARVRASQRYYKNNRRRCIDTGLRRKYGITLEQRDRMVNRQGGKCAVCRKRKRLVVDHSHNSKRVRGLLCHSCNFYLGYINEQLTIVARIRKYLVTRG